MLELKNATVIFNQGTTLEKRALDDVSVTINDGEFVTILGSNGAGKSTFFNAITGAISLESGQIFLNGKDITKQPEHVRSHTIGRLFQNPSQGTAPHLSVEENLALTGRHRGKLHLAIIGRDRENFKKHLAVLNMDLENRLKTPIGLLSGGQRQAVALIMAVLNPPELLLLDEHTAALDPKSGSTIMEITNRLIRDEKMTAMMITHNLKDALENGDRLLIFQDGKITHDISGQAKKDLTLADLVSFYDV